MANVTHIGFYLLSNAITDVDPVCLDLLNASLEGEQKILSGIR